MTGDLLADERDLLAHLLRDHAVMCRSMGNYQNGEDYPGTLRMLHKIARVNGIDASELEERP